MAKRQSYEVVAVTITYWTGGRQVQRKAGELAADIPAASIPWLLAKGSIRAAGEAKED